MQEQMEKEIRGKEAKIVELKNEMDKQVGDREARIAELQEQLASVESKCRDLQFRNEEEKKAFVQQRNAFDQEKPRIYSRGKKDAETEAAEKAARDMKSKLLELEAQQKDLRDKLEKAQAQLPALKAVMEKDVRAREIRLIERKAEFESEMAEHYGALNKFDDLVKQNAREAKQAATETTQRLEEVSRELQLKEDGMRKRKAERGNYDAYRAIWQRISDDRRILDDRLRIVQKQLNAEIERCATTADEDRSQQGSSQDLKALEKEVADIRENLAEVDEEMKSVGHASRTLSANTRFRDTSIAAESMSAGLYMMSVAPLRSVRSLTATEIDDVDAQLQNVSNATLREDLKHRKDALSAQITTLNAVTDFAHLDRAIQVLRTLHTESYPHKASYMATLDLRKDLGWQSYLARANRKTENDLSHGEWRRHRNALDRLGLLVKKQAQIVEIAGQREEHEQRLDGAIDKKIANLLEAVQSKRESLFGSHKAARIASKRAGPSRAPPISTSSSVIRRMDDKSSRPSTTTSISAKQYGEDCLQKAKLVAELRNTASAMDAQTRADKIKQCLNIYLRTVEYQMEQADAKLMAKPRTRSDVEHRARTQRLLQGLRESHARTRKRLANGTFPSAWARGSKIEDVPHSSSKRRDDDLMDETSSLSDDNATQERRLVRLKDLRTTELDPRRLASLDRQIQSLTLSLNDKRIDMMLAKRESLLPERSANLAAIETLTLEIEQSQRSSQLIAAGYVTRFQRRELARRGRLSARAKRISYEPFPDSDRTTTEINGLNMTPSPSKRAAHADFAEHQLAGEYSWNKALRERRVSGNAVRHQSSFQSVAQGQSSFGRTAAFLNDEKHGIHTHESDDVAAGFSGKHVVVNEISCTGTSCEAASDDGNAKSHVQGQSASASLSPSTTTCSHPSTNTTPALTGNMAESEEEALLAYEIPLKDKRSALIASRNSTASFWKYSMYKNAAGEAPTRHYCTNFEQTEAQIAKFAGEKVVGFDLEWEKWKSKPGEDSAKRCVSLMQIASEDKVALFHLALFRGGDSAAALLPPALRSFLENPEIIKVGVNIGGDASRLKRCFGVEMQGNIELSHLYKLVVYGETNPAKVNRGLYSLANQVKEVLHLPLSKGEVRTSSWSKRLNDQQTEYAASDAYAGLRLFHELEKRRRAMKSKPPRPAFHELGLPIMLGEDQTAPAKTPQVEQPVEATEESLDESAAFKEQDEDDSDDLFDNPADLDALDAYLDSQDASAAAATAATEPASPPLPSISYPTLPPLSEPSSPEEPSSSLPSDPLITLQQPKPKPSSKNPSPEAAQAETWLQTHLTATTPPTKTPPVQRPSKQALRAYHLWHHQNFTLEETAALLRKEPLALSTVVTYVAEVLQKEDLAFDEARVREVRARLPVSVRGRYKRVYEGGSSG